MLIKFSLSLSLDKRLDRYVKKDEFEIFPDKGKNGHQIHEKKID